MRQFKLPWQARMVAVILVAWPAFEGEPWREKTWNNWSGKDVGKILTGPPWTQPAYVPYNPLRGGEEIENSPTVRIGRIPDENTLESHPVFRQDQVFLVRWESAQVIRNAFRRSAELGLPYVSPSEMQQDDPGEDSKEYVISILADPLNQLPHALESGLKGNTVLIFHKSGRRLSPARVVVRNTHNAPTPEAYEFYFTRTDVTDREMSRENRIDIRAQVGPRIFQARFNPAKMITRRGPDF